MMSLPELSNIQIQKGNDHDDTFGGCYSRNGLPKHLEAKYYIVNLDSKRGPGTHWVLLDNRRTHECIYCDSYGQPPPEEVATAMQQTGKANLVFSDVDVQALGSQQCGWWAEYFADELADGADLKRVVAFASHHPNPDKYLATVYEKPQPGQPFQFKKQKFIEHQLTKGGGIFDAVKNRLHFKPRKHATKRFTQVLAEEGQNQIVSIQVGQEPVNNLVQKSLNVLSFGEYGKLKKKLHYDDIYHNFMVLTLADGKQFRLEKNHIVEITPYKPIVKKGYEKILYDIPVSTDQDITLESLVQNAESGNEKFWLYDPATNNCQYFVRDLIQKSSLTPKDPEILKVIEPQKSVDVMSTLPKVLQSIPRAVTDLAAVGDRLIHGDGVGRKRKRKG